MSQVFPQIPSPQYVVCEKKKAGKFLTLTVINFSESNFVEKY